MIYTVSKDDLFVRPNTTEQSLTGIHNFGYNDFHSIKPIDFFHSQPFETLHIILSGSGTYHVNNHIYKLKQGDIFYTPADTPILYYPDSNNPWSYVWYSMHTGTLSQYIQLLGLSNTVFARSLKNYDAVNVILQSILERCENNSDMTIFDFLAAFMQIMSLEACEIESSENANVVYIRSIKKFIQDNYTSQDFTVDALCGMMHLSHSYICRIFKQSEDCSIIKYIENLRMERASDLIKNTSMNINHISEAVGYKDSLHFMKCFKKKFGKTALEYRKEK